MMLCSYVSIDYENFGLCFLLWKFSGVYSSFLITFSQSSEGKMIPFFYSQKLSCLQFFQLCITYFYYRKYVPTGCKHRSILHYDFQQLLVIIYLLKGLNFHQNFLYKLKFDDLVFSLIVNSLSNVFDVNFQFLLIPKLQLRNLKVASEPVLVILVKVMNYRRKVFSLRTL